MLALLYFFLSVAPAEAGTFRCKWIGWAPNEVMECTDRAPAISKAGFCDVMNLSGGPIYWSKDDTRQTKERIDLINAAGKKLCGWGSQSSLK